MLVLGIDPGLSGSMAALHDGGVVCVESLPTRLSVRGKSDIDAKAFKEQVERLLPAGIALAVIEKIHGMPHDAISSMTTFLRGTGKLLAVLEILGIPVVEVAPPTWKAKILRDTDKSKKAAIGYVLSRWPGVSLRRNEKCRTDSHDMAEALCLAEYGWRYHLKGE